MPRNDEREGEKEGPIVSGLLQISLCLKRHESMSDWGKPSGFRRRGTPHASRYAGKVCKCKIHAVPAPLHHWTMLSPRRNLCHALNMGNTNGMNSYVYGLLAMSQASSRLSLSQNYSSHLVTRRASSNQGNSVSPILHTRAAIAYGAIRQHGVALHPRSSCYFSILNPRFSKLYKHDPFSWPFFSTQKPF